MCFLRVVVAVSLFAFANQGYALIEGQVLMGKRTVSQSGTDDVSAAETKISVYVDPIPLIPVGFGATLATLKPDTDGSSELKETSLDVTAWLPLGIAGFKPYAKLAYILAGDYGSGVKVSGTKFAAGLKYSPLPFVGFLLEVEKAAVETEYLGVSSKMDGMAGFLGVAAGI